MRELPGRYRPDPNLLGGSYFFIVPAGGSYVVVVNKLVPSLAPLSNYLKKPTATSV